MFAATALRAVFISSNNYSSAWGAVSPIVAIRDVAPIDNVDRFAERPFDLERVDRLSESWIDDPHADAGVGQRPQ
jgi:hypothetical protein